MEAIFNRTGDDVNSWKTQMHVYQKSKRTKKPFGKSLPHIDRVTTGQVKQQQTHFNPVLQTFKYREEENTRNQKEEMGRMKSLINHFKNTSKYEKGYDIVNLHGSHNQGSQQINKKLGPVRNLYNVINNQKIPDTLYKNRDLRLPVQRERVVLAKPPRQYDLISGNYKQDNEFKAEQDLRKKDEKIIDKYWKTHDYDSVFGKFYDSQKEQDFQEELKVRGVEHGKDYEKKFPPSYVHRQTYISDFTKPLPDNLKTLDEKRENAKKRFKTKYLVEDQYSKRNEEWDGKREVIVHNKIHNGRVMDEKCKEFDIVNNKNHPEDRAEKLFGRNNVQTEWNTIYGVNNYVAPSIKSSGFGKG